VFDDIHIHLIVWSPTSYGLTVLKTFTFMLLLLYLTNSINQTKALG